jgi:hypothetical protein
MKKIIWFDLDNLPHVSLFRPIFKELEKRNVDYIVTARDFNHTVEQLKFWHINHAAIGCHGGKNKIKKIVNLFERSYQLKKYIKKFDNIGLAVSHGSRTQLLTAKQIGIKSIVMMDYEYTETKIFNYFSTYMLIPRFIPDSRLSSVGLNLKKVIRYNGFKEQLYLNSFQPDENFRDQINISDDKILIVIRPPALVGNYHDPRSEKLLIDGLSYFSSKQNAICLIVSRTSDDRDFILSKIPVNENIRFLDKQVDGLQLLWAADITVSGGGTMNRESALLGTETYSIFTGKRPYLDEYLCEQGRLTFIESPSDFNSIRVQRKIKNNKISFNNNDLVNEVVDIIIKLL